MNESNTRYACWAIYGADGLPMPWPIVQAKNTEQLAILVTYLENIGQRSLITNAARPQAKVSVAAEWKKGLIR